MPLAAYLTLRRWTYEIAAAVQLELTPQYVELAPIVKAMSDQGASVNSIAAATGLCWSAAADVLEYSRTGKLPEWRQRPWSGKTRARGADRPSMPPYAKHSARIVELRDAKMTFQKIADKILEETGESISMNTARRGYQYGRRHEIRAAVDGT